MTRKSKARVKPAVSASKRQRVRVDKVTTGSAWNMGPFAVTTKGTLLINVTELETLDEAVLAGRTLFIGAELTAEERKLLRYRLAEASDELAGKLGGALSLGRPPKTKRSRS